jgi:hypothetical protein
MLAKKLHELQNNVVMEIDMPVGAVLRRMKK